LNLSNARRQADALLAKYAIRTPPVDVRDVAKRLGLRVIEMNLGDEHSGLLLTQPGTVPCIVVNEMHHENRKRFTIGHEIGHHVLRHHFGNSVVHADPVTSVSYRGATAAAGSDPKEIAANQFASSLLMPTALMRRAVDRVRLRLARDPEEVVSELARGFEVSEQAMTLRLKSLRLV
jgi:Zn-dependent peptidase ImmA (M78 family)